VTKRPPLPEGLGDHFGVSLGGTEGVSRSRARASDLESHFRGSRSIRLDRPEANGLTAAQHFEELQNDLIARCNAYLPVAPVDFRFGFVTAARLYRIPIPQALYRRASLDVAVPGTAYPPRMKGVTGHRMTSLPQLELRGGLPILPPEVVWLQLAPLLTLDELIVAGDHLVRRKRPESSMEKLRDVVAAHGAQKGAVRARAAVEEVRPGTDSPKESEMRLVLVRAGLPEPVIGFTVFDATGGWVGTPDLAYVKQRVALDYEGEVHRIDERTFLGDIERREMFADAGWRHIRVTKDHLRSPHRLISRVAPLL